MKYRDETERKKRRLEDKKMIGERRNGLVNGQEKRKRDYIMDKQKRDTHRKKKRQNELKYSKMKRNRKILILVQKKIQNLCILGILLYS